MNNIKNFQTRDNLIMIWEVLLDELQIDTNNKVILSNIKTIFDSNINPFLAKANPVTNLMELNKLFLRQVLIAVNKLLPNLKQGNNTKRITISNQEINEPYKIEDIQSLRQTTFEKEVNQRRMELDNYMTPPKPKVLDFSDGSSDSKITEMDSLIAEKMAERNQEIEFIQTSNYNTSNIDPKQWLKPSETSVKTEKIIAENLNVQSISTSNNRLKYLNIDEQNNPILLEQPKKKVSFETNNVNLNIEEIPTVSLFDKLKKLETNIEKEEKEVTQEFETTKYVTQPSIKLPEVKKEIINREKLVRNTTIMQNPPIIPNNEFIKQLNEMNKKIDLQGKTIDTLLLLVQSLIKNNENGENENGENENT